MSSKRIELKTLLEAGAHFGHRTSRWNPKMRRFIYAKRGGIHIIDLTQTADRIREASDFARGVASEGKQVLFVGTKKHIAPVVQQSAVNAGMPYVSGHWFGGILTNFDTISKRVEYFKKLSQQLESGELNETYNKREIGKFSEEKEKLAATFGGIKDMDKLPGALFVADAVNEKTAIREANRLKIPVIAVLDTNANPDVVDYPIPANDDALQTVELIADNIAEAVVRGKESYSKKPANKSKTNGAKDTAKAAGKDSANGTKTRGGARVASSKPTKVAAKKSNKSND